jgi:hypothetical protein
MSTSNKILSLLCIFLFISTVVEIQECKKWEDSFWYMDKLCRQNDKSLQKYHDKYRREF